MEELTPTLNLRLLRRLQLHLPLVMVLVQLLHLEPLVVALVVAVVQLLVVLVVVVDKDALVTPYSVPLLRISIGLYYKNAFRAWESGHFLPRKLKS